jgi:hypothetical protein
VEDQPGKVGGQIYPEFWAPPLSGLTSPGIPPSPTFLECLLFFVKFYSNVLLQLLPINVKITSNFLFLGWVEWLKW